MPLLLIIIIVCFPKNYTWHSYHWHNNTLEVGYQTSVPRCYVIYTLKKQYSLKALSDFNMGALCPTVGFLSTEVVFCNDLVTHVYTRIVYGHKMWCHIMKLKLRICKSVSYIPWIEVYFECNASRIFCGRNLCPHTESSNVYEHVTCGVCHIVFGHFQSHANLSTT